MIFCQTIEYDFHSTQKPETSDWKYLARLQKSLVFQWQWSKWLIGVFTNTQLWQTKWAKTFKPNCFISHFLPNIFIMSKLTTSWNAKSLREIFFMSLKAQLKLKTNNINNKNNNKKYVSLKEVWISCISVKFFFFLNLQQSSSEVEPTVAVVFPG